MLHLRVFAVLFLCVCMLVAPCHGSTLYRRSLKVYQGAVCIDGTAAAYYSSSIGYKHSNMRRQGGSENIQKRNIDTSMPRQYDEPKDVIDTNVNQHNLEDRKAIMQIHMESTAAKNYVIFLEGGGYCHEAGACKWRCGVAPWLCTTDPSDTRDGYGILSNDQIENPSFHDFFKVDVPYCTGDMYIGRRDSDGDTLDQHFKGRVVFDAIIANLQENTAIDRAVNVVLAGSSAGGAGVAFNCNHLKSLLPRVNVWCIVDAAFFYPVPGPLHNTSACDSIDRVLALGAGLWNAPEVAGFDLHGPWWRHIGTNVLIGTARFDRFGLESYCANSSSMWDLRDWEAGVVEKAQVLQEEDPGVSFFIPACLQHMMLTDTALYSRLRVGAYQLSYSEALWWWLNGRVAVHVWDTCPPGTPPYCNPQCWKPDLTHTPPM